jgi:hypothetical protein
MKRDNQDAQNKLITNANEKRAAEPDISSAIFGMTIQNQPINVLYRVNSKRNAKKKPMHQLEIQAGTIKAVTTAKKLDAAEAQMLDYLFYTYANTPNHDSGGTVIFTVSDYLKTFNKTDRKSAKRSIIKRLDALYDTSYKYFGGRKNDPYDPQYSGKFHLLSYIQNRGVFIVKWDPIFYEAFIANHIMPMPHSKYGFILNPRKEATALYVLRALEENKRKNASNPDRQNWMKVSTLLEYVPSLKTPGELKEEGDRHYYDRIIEPIYKAVERLARPTDKNRPIKSYCFTCGSGKNKKLLDLGDEKVDYNLFANANLEVEWNNYPEKLLKQWSKTKRSKNKDKQKSKPK